MKLNINYILLFSLLVYLKFNDSKGNDPLKLGCYVVIAYLIYRLFKGQNVEGWEERDDWGNPGSPCSYSGILYLGPPSPSPGPEDNIMKLVGNGRKFSETSEFYVGPGCIDSRLGGRGGEHALHLSQNINRERVKTIAVLSSPNNLLGPTNEGMLFCSETPNDTCGADPEDTDPPVTRETVASSPPLFHCMDGTGDNSVDTEDLLHCFSNGSACGHEQCALYHSFHLDHVVQGENHPSPSEHCSHLLYAGAVPSPTMKNGSVIQKIALKYANLDPGLNIETMRSEDLETAIIQQQNSYRDIFSNNSDEDKILCEQFNALYDSTCLTTNPGESPSSSPLHSQLFETIHEACSNINPPENYDITEDWLNTMDRYCAIPSPSHESGINYDGIPIDALRDIENPGHLNINYEPGNNTINAISLSGSSRSVPGYTKRDWTSLIRSSSRNSLSGKCSSPYIGDFTLTCNNSINRDYMELEVDNSCSSPSPSSPSPSSPSPSSPSPSSPSPSSPSPSSPSPSSPLPTQSDPSSTGNIRGCTDSGAINYNPQATIPDGNCEYANPCSPNPCNPDTSTCRPRRPDEEGSPIYRCDYKPDVPCEAIVNRSTCIDHEDCDWSEEDNKCEEVEDTSTIFILVIAAVILMWAFYELSKIGDDDGPPELTRLERARRLLTGAHVLRKSGADINVLDKVGEEVARQQTPMGRFGVN